MTAAVTVPQKGETKGISKKIFEICINKNLSPKVEVKSRGFIQISDPDKIKNFVVDCLGKYPDQIDEFKQGKHKVKGFFVGQIMMQTKGQLNPTLLQKILEEELKKMVS